MPSLAELPEIIGFFSYSREDDEAEGGGISELRERIERALREQLGRPVKTIRLQQRRRSSPPTCCGRKSDPP
jgi:hypothetical protein